MTTRLDQLEAAVTALTTRADAMMRADGARADAAGKSGTKVILSSTEIDLGRQGGGEIEFYVQVRYTIDVQTTLKSIKSIDWAAPDETGKDVDVPAKKAPVSAIETAIERYVAKNQKRYTEEVLNAL